MAKNIFLKKKTSAAKEYFGAATLTEWRAACANPNNYFFVIAQETIAGFNFIEYTPTEFEKFSSIPPFKIFFNVPLNGARKVEVKRQNKTAIQFTDKKLRKLDEVFSTFKYEQIIPNKKTSI